MEPTGLGILFHNCESDGILDELGLSPVLPKAQNSRYFIFLELALVTIITANLLESEWTAGPGTFTGCCLVYNRIKLFDNHRIEVRPKAVTKQFQLAVSYVSYCHPSCLVCHGESFLFFNNLNICATAIHTLLLWIRTHRFRTHGQ